MAYFDYLCLYYFWLRSKEVQIVSVLKKVNSAAENGRGAAVGSARARALELLGFPGYTPNNEEVHFNQ